MKFVPLLPIVSAIHCPEARDGATKYEYNDEKCIYVYDKLQDGMNWVDADSGRVRNRQLYYRTFSDKNSIKSVSKSVTTKRDLFMVKWSQYTLKNSTTGYTANLQKARQNFTSAFGSDFGQSA